MKKVILFLLLAFHAVTTTSLIAASVAPWPECLPCPPPDTKGGGGGGGGWVSPLALF